MGQLAWKSCRIRQFSILASNIHREDKHCTYLFSVYPVYLLSKWLLVSRVNRWVSRCARWAQGKQGNDNNTISEVQQSTLRMLIRSWNSQNECTKGLSSMLIQQTECDFGMHLIEISQNRLEATFSKWNQMCFRHLRSWKSFRERASERVSKRQKKSKLKRDWSKRRKARRACL